MSMHVRPSRLAWLTLAALPAAAVAGDDSERTIRRSFDVRPGQEIRLDLRWGELEIQPTDGNAVEIVFEVECRGGGDRCRRRLAELDVAGETRRDRLEIEVTGLSRWENAKAQLRMVARVPRQHSLFVDMGAGEVVVEGFGADLEIDLGAGEIRVRMPEDRVSSVDLSAGVGDTTLRRGDGKVVSNRSHLVGSTVRWDDGSGDAHVEVHVGAGEVDVRLD
jgi:hypothetical protein